MHQSLKNLDPPLGFKGNVYDILHVKCRYIDFGCTVTPTAKNLNEHEQNCVFKNMRVKQVRGKGKKKMSLSQVKDGQSCKNGCLKDFFDFFETKCAENHENKTDVLFFMLRNNTKRAHTQLNSRKQVIAFQDRVITINIKEAQHPLK